MSRKKETVLDDILRITGKGLYAIMPFEKLDRKKKAVFKIGQTTSFRNRFDQYHTYFPKGVYYVAFLQNPPIPKPTRRNPDETPTVSQLLKIEKFILNRIEDLGGEPIYSTTRVQNQNQDKEGKTEWIYTNEQSVHIAFQDAHKKFGGQLHLFYLEGFDPLTQEFSSINDNKNETQKPNYIGQIVYHL